MLYPLTILLAALLAAAVTAYGSDAAWAAHAHGFEFIMLSRRLQWPLGAMIVIVCLTLLAMIAAGRWRAWWLIGLTPILTLLGHRFLTDPNRAMQVDAAPTFVSANQAGFVRDDDYVVGLSFAGETYAYPFDVLYEDPIVAQARPRQRLLLIWSAYANRAIAAETDWTVKPRELEITSEPANALLVYNSRLGQFINGVTGLTPDGKRPTGFGADIPTIKMPWKTWRQLHPQTLVLRPPDDWIPGAPTQPVAPRYPMPGMPVVSRDRVALIDAPRPLVVRETDVKDKPLNMVAGSFHPQPLLLFRDSIGLIKAFERQANGDLTPRFYPALATGHANAVWTERDTNTWWSEDGRAVDGPLKGEKLKPFVVDDQVYLDVIRYWLPNVLLITPKPQDVGQPPQVVVPHKPSRRSGSRKPRVPAKTAVTAPGRVISSS
jgi:hypothetical protein